METERELIKKILCGLEACGDYKGAGIVRNIWIRYMEEVDADMAEQYPLYDKEEV